MGYFVYRGVGRTKQLVAGPFNTQTIADIVTTAMADQDAGSVLQTAHNEGAGGKQTIVTTKSKDHGAFTASSAKTTRTQDNDT